MKLKILMAILLQIFLSSQIFSESSRNYFLFNVGGSLFTSTQNFKKEDAQSNGEEDKYPTGSSYILAISYLYYKTGFVFNFAIQHENMFYKSYRAVSPPDIKTYDFSYPYTSFLFSLGGGGYDPNNQNLTYLALGLKIMIPNNDSKHYFYNATDTMIVKPSKTFGLYLEGGILIGDPGSFLLGGRVGLYGSGYKSEKISYASSQLREGVFFSAEAFIGFGFSL